MSADSCHPLPYGFADFQVDEQIKADDPDDDDLSTTLDYPRHIQRLTLR